MIKPRLTKTSDTSVVILCFCIIDCFTRILDERIAIYYIIEKVFINREGGRGAVLNYS